MRQLILAALILIPTALHAQLPMQPPAGQRQPPHVTSHQRIRVLWWGRSCTGYSDGSQRQRRVGLLWGSEFYSGR